MWTKQSSSIVLLLALLVGCRTMERAPLSGTQVMLRTELLFGLSIPGGGEVSEGQWQGFVDEIVTPRFPDGFTVVDGRGQYRENSGTIAHERSKLLILLHERNLETIRKLDEIRDEYKKRFRQEAVIRESGDVWVSF